MTALATLHAIVARTASHSSDAGHTEPADRAAPALSPQVMRRADLQAADIRSTYVRTLFNDTARHYDRINGVLSLGTGRWYRHRILRRIRLRSGDRVLDVGCGTGVIAALAQEEVGPTGRVVGLDPSPGMLEQARRRGVRELVEGVADALPFADESFDVVTMGYALRHVEDIDVVFGEYRRVLRPGGRLAMMEITRPEGRVARSVFRVVMAGVVPAASGALCVSRRAGELMAYFHETIEHCVAPSVVLDALDRAGFRQIRRRMDLGVLCAYTAARPPAALHQGGLDPATAESSTEFPGERAGEPREFRREPSRGPHVVVRDPESPR